MSDNLYESLESWGTSLFSGEKIELRELRPEDLETLSQWMNHSANLIFRTHRMVKQPEKNLREILEKECGNDTPFGCGYCITDKKGTLVGALELGGIKPPVLVAQFAIMIGPEFQGMGYGRDAIKVALRLAFEEMGAHKVALQVWSYNERAIHLYKKCGFKEEGRIRAAAYHRSQFFDELHMGILIDEYQAMK